MSEAIQKEIVQLLMKKKILVTESIIQKIKSSSEEKLADLKEKVIQNPKFIFSYSPEAAQNILDSIPNSSVEVTYSFKEEVMKKEVGHFVQYFKRRYEVL